MTMPRADAMGPFVTAALLEAAKGKCQCNTCRLMRKASSSLTASLLGGNPGKSKAAAGAPTDITDLVAITEEEE